MKYEIKKLCFYKIFSIGFLYLFGYTVLKFELVTCLKILLYARMFNENRRHLQKIISLIASLIIF